MSCSDPVTGPDSGDLTELRQRVRDLEAAIAAYRSSEETLRGSEARFRALVETSSDWIWETDARGRYTYASPKVRDLLGYEVEEVLGKSPFDFMPPAEAERVSSMVSRSMATACPIVAVENWNRRRDGRMVLLETSGVPVFDAGGRPVGYRGIDRDITDRKMAEEALIARETAVAAALNGIALSDPVGNLTYVNRSFLRLWGYENESEVLGRPASAFWESGEQALRVIEELQRHSAWEGELTGRRKDGSRFDVQLAATLVRDKSGGILGMMASFSDITERKKTDQALRDEFDFRDGIIACAAEGLCVCHGVEAYPHVEFTVWNPRMTEITGYTMEEINRRGWYQTLYPDPDVQAKAKRRMDRMRLGENLQGEEWEITRSDGTLRLISLSTSIVRKRSDEVHVLALIQDVTERRHAEEERRRLEGKMLRAQKLESLGVLAGGIAHDFNNLLTAILGHTGLALDELPPESAARGNLKEVERASYRAAELCRQMLAYSGRGRFVVEPIDLNRLVGDLMHLLRVSISKKSMLRCHLADGLPAIEADPAQLRQVILNLLTNASEAIGDREGIIAISTSVRDCVADGDQPGLPIGVPAAGRYVCFEVTDTGIGMDAGTQARIFDPFFTTKFTGRGLGLAAVLGIMRGHKGGIRVESKPGAGSAFQVFFPVSTRSAATVEDSKEAEQWRGNGTVLVADDEESVRGLACAVIERCGLRVLPAADGHEAVQLFRQHSDEVVCVLLDLTMPRMDGEEAYRELVRIRPDVPVILASGYTEEEINRRFEGLRLSGIIEKPYRAAALTAKLREVLAQNRPRE